MMDIPIIGIAAHGSDSGKTRLLLALLAEFGARGVRVAVLKHAQHVSLPPDKDGSLFMKAGATATLVVAPSGWLMTAAPEAEPDFAAATALLRRQCQADLLLTEGYKRGPQPKLLLSGQTLGEEHLLPHTLAIVSDVSQKLALPCFSSTDVVGISDFIMHVCERGYE